VSQIETISKKRVAILLLTILVIIFALIFRVIYLQFFLTGWLKKSAESQRFRAIQVLPRRGTIYDRNSNELAISIDGDSIYAIPAEIGIGDDPVKYRGKALEEHLRADKLEISRILSETLGMEREFAEGLISKRASFVWIKRKAKLNEIDALRKIITTRKITGIEFSQKPRRFYPQAFLAAQILGIAGIDNQGLEGIEKQYDIYLRGVPGSDQAEFDTAGRHIPQGERRYLEPINGDALYLTIDENIQYIVERELEKAVVDTKSKRGMSVVVDPQNGDILAAAAIPKYDPNNFNDYPPENRRNPIFTDMYEPGSTFKVFTTIAALEEGKVSLQSTFFDPGFIIVDDRRLRCWKPGGHGSQTFLGALENSCNPVFASLALRIGKDTLYQYISAFGFGRPTGVDFPGESPGRLQSLAKVKNVELANIGFGQGITVTPIQLAMGVSAIANGGYLLKPHLVKKIVGPDGKVKRSYSRQVAGRVASPKTAALMAKLLQSVVTNGSGNRAYLEGYQVAGKTGTAQKVSQGTKGYSKVMASFIGFAPAENSRLVALVVLDEPSCSITYGGVIAAPVVGNIFRDALRYLNVRPKYEPEILEKITSQEVVVPNILNMPIGEATQLLAKKEIQYRFIGKGSYVFDQIPKPGAKINRNTKVLIYFDPEEHYNLKNSNKSMLPNFQGCSLRKVDEILSEMGLKLEAKGTGIAVSQNPPAGTVVGPGSTVSIIFRPNEDNSP
jgi:stage V sporulation protein D (sporulation-specific penicillin-binding protein)